MNARQRAFAQHYIESGVAEEAAIKAGYSRAYAKAQSYKLLENVGVKSYIDELLARIESANIASATETLKYLTSVMRGEETEQVPILCGDGCQELIEKEIGAKDRLKAAELLGKRYGIFTDKIDLSAALVQIVDDIGGDGDA